MATVINTPATRDTSDSAASGWAVAVIVLLAVGLLALFVWPGFVRNSATPTDNGTNINVSLPSTPSADTGSTGGTGNTGGTGGGTGGTVTQ